MKDQHQQIQGEVDEAVHGNIRDGFRDRCLPDGYSGPRACMVHDSRNHYHSETNTTWSDDAKLGIMERLTLAMLAGLVSISVLVSIIVLPFGMLGYFFYQIIKKIYKSINSKDVND